MEWTDLFVLSGSFAALAGPILAFLFRKHIGRWILRTMLSALREDFFDQEVVKDKDGKKTKRMVPNDHLGELMAEYAPGLMDWASKNVKIKMPQFTLPEGMDLKTAGAQVLIQKGLSGKRIKLEDGLLLAAGYAKDWAEKTGILDVFKGGKKAAEKAGTALTPEAQKIVDKALNP